jgi:hypothetical protein
MFSQTCRIESFGFSVPAVRIVFISQLPENTLDSQICLCVIRLPDKSPRATTITLPDTLRPACPLQPFRAKAVAAD